MFLILIVGSLISCITDTHITKIKEINKNMNENEISQIMGAELELGFKPLEIPVEPLKKIITRRHFKLNPKSGKYEENKSKKYKEIKRRKLW